MFPWLRKSRTSCRSAPDSSSRQANSRHKSWKCKSTRPAFAHARAPLPADLGDALPHFVAEDVAVRPEGLAARIGAPHLEHRPKASPYAPQPRLMRLRLQGRQEEDPRLVARV